MTVRATEQQAPTWRAIPMTTYSTQYRGYMDSAAWQVTRARVMIRANGWCESCGNDPARAVHHLSYRSLGHEADDDLLAVCNRCHRSRHIKRRPQGQDGLDLFDDLD